METPGMLRPVAATERTNHAVRSLRLPKSLRRLRRQLLLIAGGLIFLVVLASALLARWVAPYDPVEIHTAYAFRPPSASFLLGTDQLGRDVLSRLIFGAQVALYVGGVSVAIALVVGAASGVVGAFYGGLADTIIMRTADVLLSFPTILLALLIISGLGPSLDSTAIAIGIVFTPQFARLARALTLSAKETDYIGAARVLGASDLRILIRHVLPNIVPSLLVQASLSFSVAILAETSLGYLGLGAQPPQPSWGYMLNEGRAAMTLAPWLSIYPGLAIMLAVLALNLIGDGLRDLLDPRLR